jgi:hypothetical protein
MANKNPPIMINGTNIQAKKIINPETATKTRNKIPATIKTILIIAPNIRENEFEIKVLKNSPTAKPLG